MIISVDHGNAAIKTVNCSFISGIKNHSVRPAIAADMLEYDGSFFTLTNERIPYMRDKTKDDRFYWLTLFAIAKELQFEGNRQPLQAVDLAVGLPLEHFGKQRAAFMDYFRRPSPVKFVHNDTPRSIMIENVFVFPQAYAAVIPDITALKQKNRVFVIDIGGFTTDITLLCNGQPDLNYWRSLENGIITMINEIKGRVNTLFALLIEDDHVQSILMGRETVLGEDVKRLVRDEARGHALQILDKLRELKVDLRANPAVFCGGGSALLKPYLQESGMLSNAQFVTNPNANAIGYSTLAAAKLNQMRRSLTQ